MAPEHFHRPTGKRLHTPISASHFRAKLKITFALLIAQMERDHAISLSTGPATPQKRPNAAVEEAGDNEEQQGNEFPNGKYIADNRRLTHAKDIDCGQRDDH